MFIMCKQICYQAVHVAHVHVQHASVKFSKVWVGRGVGVHMLRGRAPEVTTNKSVKFLHFVCVCTMNLHFEHMHMYIQQNNVRPVSYRMPFVAYTVSPVCM